MALAGAVILLVGTLTAVLLIHEAGHYAAASLVRAPVVAVVVGVGPALARWRSRDGVEWRVSILPVIGWMSMDVSARTGTSPIQRMLIAVAGPGANLLTGVLLSVLHGSGVRATGGLPGMWEGAAAGWVDAWRFVGVMTLNSVAAVINVVATDTLPAVTSSFGGAMAGPGWWNGLLLGSAMSLGLATVNLLPLPCLDAGHVVVLGIEAVLGPRLARTAEKALYVVGSAFLLGLVFVSP
jgi:membrane-associated protease RseP (regulator of RpoE activity)